MSSYNVPLGTRVKGAKPMDSAPRWEDFGLQMNRDPDGGNPVAEGHEATEVQEETLAGPAFEKARQEAYAAGLADGERRGREEGIAETTSEIEPKLMFLDKLIKSVQEERESFFQENELHIVKLAIEIAKRIIQTELQQNPEILLYVVREAMRRVGDSGRIVARVHPEDLGIVDSAREILGNQISAFAGVDFVSSDEVERGGCVIDSVTGIVDAQMNVQLERIEEILLEGVDG